MNDTFYLNLLFYYKKRKVEINGLTKYIVFHFIIIMKNYKNQSNKKEVLNKNFLFRFITNNYAFSASIDAIAASTPSIDSAAF